MSNNKCTTLQQITRILLLMIMSQVMSHTVQAQIYKCENSVGDINFSDEPCSKGEASTRLNWLKSTPAAKRKKPSSSGVYAQAKKTAAKARKNNQAYVLLSLLTTTRLELETATLRSSLGDAATEAPELLLPDGITVDLLKVDKILFSRTYGKTGLRARFIMADGYEQEVIIHKPYPVISGESKIGRFSKSIEDIKQVEFFNSKKLLKARGKKTVPKQNKKAGTGKTAVAAAAREKPAVIELDLSHEEMPPAGSSKKTLHKNAAKPEIKVLPSKQAPAVSNNKAQVIFVDDRQTWVLKASLGSSRNSKKSASQRFILNDREQIPYDQIKTIRVRPTADRSKLVVAVALKSGEIKMENMLKPFTRILGNTGSGTFNHSLLDIKSISFQR